MPGRIRLVSWNVRAAIGPGEPFPPAWWRHVRRERLEEIGAFIGELDADVVTLQEVTIMTVDGAVHDQPAELARITGMAVRYGAVHSFPLVEPETGRAIGTAMWGNAILSRRQISNGFAQALPRAADDDLVEPVAADHPLAGTRYADVEPGHREPRCAVGGVIDGVTIVTAHLTYIGREQRLRQVAALAAIAEERPGPLVISGDLNAPVTAPEVAPLRDGLVDAFAAADVPADDARRASCGAAAIDHVFVRGLAVDACRVAVEAGDLSDHWPVVADLRQSAVPPTRPA